MIKRGIVFLILLANIPFLNGQKLISPDSLFTKILDADFRETSVKKIGNKNIILLITNSNCSGCVKYFTNSTNNYTYIFVLQNESLLEAEQTKNRFRLGHKNVYFTTNEYYQCGLIDNCEKPTPNCIYFIKNKIYFANYKLLDSLSAGFTLAHSKLKANLSKTK